MSSKQSREKKQLETNREAKEIGAMTPCTGCKYAGQLGDASICSRFPPVWTTQLIMEVQTASGMPEMSKGGWTFPPSAMKCGEFVDEEPKP